MRKCVFVCARPSGLVAARPPARPSDVCAPETAERQWRPLDFPSLTTTTTTAAASKERKKRQKTKPNQIIMKRETNSSSERHNDTDGAAADV